MHYMHKLCTKTQFMCPNYALKYKTCTKIMRYASKAKLYAKEPITRFLCVRIVS